MSWRIAHISEKTFIYILSLVVGALAGLAALLLRRLIHFVEYQLTGWFADNTYSFLYLAYPLIGITLASLFVRYAVKDDINHGVSKILYSISRQSGRLKPHNMWTSMVASSTTIGFGGSVGAEAPIVLTGASIGSNLAQLFKLNYKYVILMIGCGAAGAIGGIFKAPIAGLVFTLEVLMLDMTMAYLLPLMIASITAASISYIFMGGAIVMKFELVNSFTVTNIGFYILLGVFAGVVSLYFTRSVMWQESLYKKIKKPVYRLLTGGIILSLLIFLLPPLWGEGYASIVRIFNGEGADLLNNSVFYGWKDNNYLFILVLLMILFLKVVATAATTGGGGIGGVFAPTLFTGAISGFLLSRMLNVFFHLNLPEENFALAGMAGLMAGVMHAPLTGIFLTAEITGGYGLFVPLIITSTVSYLTMTRFEPHSIYTKHLALKGDLITHHKDKAVLKLMQTRNLIETDFEILRPGATLRDLVNAISRSQRNLFPVVDKDGMMKGMVKLSDIRTIIFETDLYDKVKIKALMYMPKYYVSPYDSMEDVVAMFESSGRFNLAVIDKGKYMGFLSRARVFSDYRENIRDFSSD
ncbi:MAG: chloride channel protein [Prolixibacteraceae bacterium]|nr:chloride channel protein [Prolixibacteraceae bacterium]